MGGSKLDNAIDRKLMDKILSVTFIFIILKFSDPGTTVQCPCPVGIPLHHFHLLHHSTILASLRTHSIVIWHLPLEGYPSYLTSWSLCLSHSSTFVLPGMLIWDLTQPRWSLMDLQIVSLLLDNLLHKCNVLSSPVLTFPIFPAFLTAFIGSLQGAGFPEAK